MLGCDQGYATFGYCLVDYRQGGDFTILASGTVRTKAAEPFEERIHTLYDFVDGLIGEYAPAGLGLERLFFRHSQENFRSASIIKTNMVSGLLFLLASQHRLKVKEFTPASVKKRVTGNGRATKEEMKQAVLRVCEAQGIAPKTDHEFDAIGIALTTAEFFAKEKQGGETA